VVRQHQTAGQGKAGQGKAGPGKAWQGRVNTNNQWRNREHQKITNLEAGH
jgi:hypothetical protein